VPKYLSNSYAISRLRESTELLAHLFIFTWIIAVRTAPGRGHKSHKAYIALFVYLTTKILHLELVSDYSSATFIAAYQLFVFRRGLLQSMYFDNGTTFLGANRELSDAQVIRDPNFRNRLAISGSAWHFLPSASSHFGGLWKAGMKSVKHHSKRCIGLRTLTFEEMSTLLWWIACLNSRSIAPVSDNFDDYNTLTSGLFLIGTSLIAPAERSQLKRTVGSFAQ